MNFTYLTLLFISTQFLHFLRFFISYLTSLCALPLEAGIRTGPLCPSHQQLALTLVCGSALRSVFLMLVKNLYTSSLKSFSLQWLYLSYYDGPGQFLHQLGLMVVQKLLGMLPPLHAFVWQSPILPDHARVLILVPRYSPTAPFALGDLLWVFQSYMEVEPLADLMSLNTGFSLIIISLSIFGRGDPLPLQLGS